ncbi:MAG: GSCFA domain-containing protein [Bacteroidetes bacterium]|nr:GSCFA domain-containing protein [Bacteroidota bacterium]
MDFMLDIDIKKPALTINYQDKILLTGSCFTEHIGNALQELKFPVLQNPNGILFDPVSVCKSLVSYVHNKKYAEADLFSLNEIWNSWQHHSRFSNISREEGLYLINESQQKAHDFLKQADWMIITLGSSFSYRLTKQYFEEFSEAPPSAGLEESVANCHRAPAQWFHKHLLETDTIISQLDNCYHQLLQFNPDLKIIFTVSPVRHIRDGVIENNRSKARLIEAVHHLVNKFDRLYYFPAYELVIDVLRDYRFYDIDLVHPNYMATEFVLEKFAANYIDNDSRQLMQEVKKIVIAAKHKAFQPDTKAHQQFLVNHFTKAKLLQEKYPFLNLKEELMYFSGG